MDDLIAKAISNAKRDNPAAKPANQPNAVQNIQAGDNSSISGVRQDMSSGRSSHVSVQNAMAGGHSDLKNITQEVTQYFADRNYYFDIKILKPSGVDTTEIAEPVTVSLATPLQQGATYIARVSLSLNKYRSYLPDPSRDWRITQKPVKIHHDLRLFLGVTGDKGEVDVFKSINGQNADLPIEQLAGWCRDFKLVLQDKCPAISVTLDLTFCEMPGGLPRCATSLVIDIDGDVNPLPRKIREACLLPLNAESPEHTAILHISPEGKDQIRLIGWVRDWVNRPLSFSPISLPKMTVTDNKEFSYVKGLQKKTHDFAISNAGNISGWLDKVVELYGEECCVIIVDQADSEIMWEMFKLSDGKYLGARAAIIRWAESQYRHQPVTLQLQKNAYTGRAVAYVHPHDNAAMSNECPDLYSLADKQYDSLDDLLFSLIPSREVDPIGLVYLSHNGMFVYGDEQDALENLPNPQGSRVELRFDEIEGLLNPRPIFFVNTPFSGRVLFRKQQACGLAKAALTQVAAGFLGTLGPIDPNHAARIARRLFDAATRPGGVNLAHLLRDLRAEAAQAITNTKLTPEDRRSLLQSTFMYVYYGNPHARLQVLLPSVDQLTDPEP